MPASRFINFNGKILKGDLPIITAANRGLRYGDGLFETIKLKHGQLLQQQQHFERLWQGLAVLQMDLPKYFSVQKLTDQIVSLAEKNGCLNFGRVRLNFFRGDGGLYDTPNQIANYTIEVIDLPGGSEEWNSNGLIVGIYTEAIKPCDRVSNMKHNNYLPYVLAALEAKKQKWNDALVLNQFIRIADSTIANVFYIKDDCIYTPDLGEAPVAGIMRAALLSYLQKNAYKIEEGMVTMQQLLQADEIFLTNSIYPVRWVQRIGETVYANTVTQKIYQQFTPTIF